MILNIVAFKNEIVGAYTNPQYIDIEPKKAAIQLARSMKIKPELATTYQNLTMWYLGDFDDETGAIEQLQAPELLLDCRTVWKEMQNELLCTSGEHSEEQSA